MPIVQSLSKKQMAESLQQAISRQIPVLLTCQIDGAWRTLRTRIIGADAGGLWIAQPTCVEEQPPELSAGQQLGLSFKFKHHKHILNAAIESVGPLAVSDDEVEAIRVRAPRRMQRVQRRAYHRVDVPQNRSVLVTFWLGGKDGAEGEGALTWEGWVTNISAGGFQVRIASHGGPGLEVGDLVGVRVELGQEYEPITADAQFRQETVDDRGISLQGFQFVGLNETSAGQEVLHRVGSVVCEFQRYQNHHKSSVA